MRTHSSLPLLAIVLASTPAMAAPPERPNFVIILADDLGYGDLGCYGSTGIRTPALGRLAAEGLLFTDFHSSGAVCSPTRAGLLTGRYQQRAGVEGVIYADPKQNRHHGLQLEEITLAEALASRGYRSSVFGKWHLGYEPRYNPLEQGFEQFAGFVSGNIDYQNHLDRMGIADWWQGRERRDESGYSTHLITRHARRALERFADGEAPFCLYVAHEAPHTPFQGPGDPGFRVAGRVVPERRSAAERKRAYREMVVELDRGVGEVIETIRALGMAERTLVLFLSDNGGTRHGSNGVLRGFKGGLYEGGHRVPAIAWWPGLIEPGRRTDRTAMSIDILPTLLDLAGVDAEGLPAMDGVSLRSTLFDEADAALERDGEPRTLFWEYGRSRAVRRGRWKLVQSISRGRQKGRRASGAGRPAKVELYDLASDISESMDLAAVEPARVRELSAALEAWRRDVQADRRPQPAEPSKR